MNLLKELLNEAREDYIAQQMGPSLTAAFERDNGRKPQTDNIQPIDIVNHLSAAGPEYVQWTARQYAKGTIKWEDIPQVQTDLTKFKQLAKINAVPNKDINSYKTIADLRNVTRDRNIAGATYKGKYEKLYQGLDAAVNKGIGKWIYNNPDDPIKIYVPLNEKGSMCIRAAYPDISWCTTYEEDTDEVIRNISNQLWSDMSDDEREDWDDNIDDFRSHVQQEIEDGNYADEWEENKENLHDYYIKAYGGEYYVILTPSGPYQFHFESNQFKDENDEDIDYKQLAATYPSIKKILSPIVTKIGHPHFVPATDLASIKKAVQASLENLGQVEHRQLSSQDMADIAVKKLTGLSRYDDSNAIRDILSTTLSKLSTIGKYSLPEIADVFEHILTTLPPRKILAKQIPYTILPYLDPTICKQTVDGYVVPRGLVTK